MASFSVAKSRIIISTIVAVFFPVLVFVALQLENGLPNMCLFILYLTYPITGTLPNSDVASWGDAFAWSIIPSSLGNMLGGFLLGN
jgi:formate/nitrite transporter FocA (FNT family)